MVEELFLEPQRPLSLEWLLTKKYYQNPLPITKKVSIMHKLTQHRIQVARQLCTLWKTPSTRGKENVEDYLLQFQLTSLRNG